MLRTSNVCMSPPAALCTLFALLIVATVPERALAQRDQEPNSAEQQSAHPASDGLALNEILNDSYLADSALAVHQHAATMSVERRYVYLLDWVLPSSNHSTIRTSLDFTPVHPAPPLSGGDEVDIEIPVPTDQTRRTPFQAGGQLVAPAWDLVLAAKELGLQDELFDRVSETAAFTDSQRRSQLALLTLVNIARKRPNEALKALEDLSRLVRSGTQTEFTERWPETLALWAGLQDPNTRELAGDLLEYIFETQVQPRISSGSESWRHHIFALVGLHRHFKSKSGLGTFPVHASESTSTQWHEVSRSTAQTRGKGFPRSHWQLEHGGTTSIVSHDEDYLYFGVPLRGDFEVEGDVTAGHWRDSCLSVAGRWIHPLSDRQSYRIGTFRDEAARGQIEPQMSRFSNWIRYRSVVRKGICTTYVNGREIHSEHLSADHDPWLAIRSTFYYQGSVRNLRITGDPQIPDALRLSVLPDLTGWLPYFNESLGGPGSTWQQSGVTASDGEIIGTRTRNLPTGSARESLLQYHRPMLEDGTIAYEFYYRPSESQVHPALDRLAFVLDPRGLRVHWITDGQFDRTGIDPANLLDEPQNRRGPPTLPLKSNAWNRLKLMLSGDVIHVVLNDQEIYERILEATNQRTFGLFHYSDQTEARVRNVVWRGDWPRELPPVSEQELAGDGTEFLDKDVHNLTSIYEHDFTASGLLADRFTVFENGWRESVVPQPDGVHVARSGLAGRTLNFSIVPRCLIQGDFDVTASFRKFEPVPSPESGDTKCSLMLSAVLNDEAQTRTYLARRFTRTASQEDTQTVQGSFNQQTADHQTRRSYFGGTAFEAESGTLRLARRGKTLYYLVAENDSTCFRLIGETVLSDADLHEQGIRLHTQTAGPGVTKVVWTRLSIHATKVTDLFLAERDAAIRTLQNQLTGNLPSNALQFDGQTQYVTIPSIRYDGAYPITLEAFVIHDRFRSIVVGDTQQSGLGLGVPSDRYNMHAWNGRNYNAAISDTRAATNVRIHLAGSFDGRSLFVFLNGKLLKTAALQGKFGASGFPLTIGASPSPIEAGIDYAFSGIIDGVRISKRIRYTKNFEPPVRLEADADTLALYQFDEGTGSTLGDSSGNGHYGDIRGPEWVTDIAIRHRAAQGLVQYGEHAVPVLVEALSHQTPTVRLEAATALGLVGKNARSAVAALRVAAEDKDQRVSKAASEAIVHIESGIVIQQLMNAFEHSR